MKSPLCLENLKCGQGYKIARALLVYKYISASSLLGRPKKQTAELENFE